MVSHKLIYGGITSNVGGYITYTYKDNLRCQSLVFTKVSSILKHYR